MVILLKRLKLANRLKEEFISLHNEIRVTNSNPYDWAAFVLID